MKLVELQKLSFVDSDDYLGASKSEICFTAAVTVRHTMAIIDVKSKIGYSGYYSLNAPENVFRSQLS